MSVIVIGYTTVDGIVSDPDGADGTPAGGWMFRLGPEIVAGDKFRIGSVLANGALLLGRRTWESFSKIWPNRDDKFSARMNAVPKLVATRTLTDLSAWANSQVVEGDLVEVVRRERRDVVVMGSIGVARDLMAEDVVDEYRLITLPTILGTGERLFPASDQPKHLECRLVEQVGAVSYARYTRTTG